MKQIIQLLKILLLSFCVTNAYSATVSLSDTVKITAYLNKAKEFQYSQPDSTLYYAEKAQSMSNDIDWILGSTQAYFYLASAYRVKSEFKKSKAYFDSTLTLAQEINHKIIISYCYNSLGFIHQKMANYPMALQYYHKFYETAIANNDTISQSIAINNQGIVYYYLKDYDKALEKYHEATEIMKTVENGRSKIATNYNNIATIHQEMKNYGLALEFYNKALFLHLEYNYLPGLINVYNNLGSVHRLLGELEDAAKYISKSIEISKKIEDNFSLAGSLNELGLVYQELKDWDEAKDAFIKSLEICKSIDARQIMLDNYYSLSLLYQKIGDYDMALEYMVQYNQLNDRIFANEKKKSIKKLNKIFDSERKGRLNMIEGKDKLKSEINQQNIFFRVVTAFFIAVLILIFYLIYRFRNRTLFLKISRCRQNKFTKTQSLKVRTLVQKLSARGKQIDFLKIRNLQLKEVNEKIINLISGDFDSSINSVKKYIDLINSESLSIAEITEMAPQLSQQISSTAENWKSIVMWKMILMKEMEVKKVVFNVQNLLEDNIAFFRGKLVAETIEISHDLPANTMVWADKELVNVLIRYLLRNSIHFTCPGNAINICFQQNNDFVEISIKNIGMNLHEDMMDPMFYAVMRIKAEQNQQEVIGFDFALCQELVKINKGHVNVHKQENQLITFTFSLPKPSK
ncbi:MAG: tetratricopeptide repeat protein [bacterium]